MWLPSHSLNIRESIPWNQTIMCPPRCSSLNITHHRDTWISVPMGPLGMRKVALPGHF